MKLQTYANQTTLSETIKSALSTPWMSLVQPFPLPAAEAKSKQPTTLQKTVNGLLHRNGMSVIRTTKKSRVVDEEASSIIFTLDYNMLDFCPLIVVS